MKYRINNARAFKRAAGRGAGGAGAGCAAAFAAGVERVET
jgi:hypothetical protein